MKLNSVMVVKVTDQSRSLVGQSWRVLKGKLLHQTPYEEDVNGQYVSILTLTPDSVVEKVISVGGNDPYRETVKVYSDKEIITTDRASWGDEIFTTEVKKNHLYDRVTCHCGRFVGLTQGKAVLKCPKCKDTLLIE